MNGSLLDTNIIIGLLSNEPSIVQRLTSLSAIYLPIIAVGELYFGAYKSARSEENVAKIIRLVSRSTVLPCTATTSRHYGQIKAGLQAKGKPIPENDIWIAAIAQQYEMTVITRDAHFNEVSVEMW